MSKKRSTSVAVAVVIVSLLAMIGAARFCIVTIRNDLTEQMNLNLEKIAVQNIEAVRKEVNEKVSLIEGMASHIPAKPLSIDNVVNSLKDSVDIYDFSNVGYSNIRGEAYTTNGQKLNIIKEGFFKRSLAGEVVVCELTNSLIDDTDGYITVISAPIYGDDEIVYGVLFATYNSAWLGKTLLNNSIVEQSFSCLIDRNGRVVAHSDESPISNEDNFFVFLEGASKIDEKSLMNVLNKIDRGESGLSSFCSDIEHDFYYVPITGCKCDIDWYSITIVPDSVVSGQLRNVNLRIEWMLLGVIAVGFFGIVTFLWTVRSRSEQLRRLAYVDAVTGGDNMACFHEKIRYSKLTSGYIVAMDLTEFKVINNICGTEVGDMVLCSAWSILNENLRERELLARIYADRFVMLLEHTSKEELTGRIEKLVDDINGISENLNVPRIVPVFGICESDELYKVDQNYGNAVRAKSLVKGRRDREYAFFEELDHNQIVENREIEDNFDDAMRTKRFEVWYQPKYDTLSGKIVGAEALVRLRKKDGEIVPPYKFIPIFEKNGMIPQLDEYVFRTVCNQQKKWLEQGLKVPPVSVNISRVSLYYSNIADRYKAIPESIELATEYLQLEITESATIDNAEISLLIEKFHDAGFTMLLDDFGTGYSSLSTLNVLHFDTMKLDKSLIDYIGDSNGEKLLDSITKLGQNLGLHITAEGVETKEQLDFLKDLKCDDIQGYYFSKPLPVDQYEKLLLQQAAH